MSSKWLILVCEPASKRRRGRPRKNGGQETASITSTSKLTDVAPGADMEGLDNLLSVAEAFERSQQPDFNDITHPGMTDISNCLLIAVSRKQVMQDKIPIFALLAMYVTNFSCISYCSNSEYWTQKRIQNESIQYFQVSAKDFEDSL